MSLANMTAAAPEAEWNAAALPSPGSSPQATPSQTQPQTEPKARVPGIQHKKRKAKAARLKNNTLQVDGAVSDSVVPPMASPQSKNGPKQRQQSAALPVQHAQAAKQNIQKQRPVSMGGNMLPATPLKEQAYAGPTFQASPAASALPMPKFFSKSVPNVAQKSASLDARMAGQKTPEQESSPEPDVVSPQPPRATQSPLDVFFNAQKAENQRISGMQSPEMKVRQAPPATEPRNPFQQTGRSIFLRELDGDSDATPSPKTVPPNNHDRDALNQSLKDLLFNGPNALPQNGQPQNAITPPQRSTANLLSPEQPFYTPSSSQRSTSSPSTPAPSAEQQNNYSLHYGNRNLSPFFKAARGETPSRPSNLRQHSSASNSSPINGQPPQQSHQIDPNSFSRNYLDQHIRASQPATMPNMHGVNGVNGMNGYPQQSYQPPHQHHPIQQGVPASGSGASPRTSSNGARDNRSMEDDLRRMLKINVLGN